MKVRIFSNCGQYNPPETWNCIDCGATLSIKSIAETDNSSLPKTLKIEHNPTVQI